MCASILELELVANTVGKFQVLLNVGLFFLVLQAMEEDAESLAKKIDPRIIGTAKTDTAAKGKGKKPAVVSKWQEAEMQKGAMRRESVVDNLKDALTKREVRRRGF